MQNKIVKFEFHKAGWTNISHRGRGRGGGREGGIN